MLCVSSTCPRCWRSIGRIDIDCELWARLDVSRLAVSAMVCVGDATLDAVATVLWRTIKGVGGDGDLFGSDRLCVCEVRGCLAIGSAREC